MVKKRLSKFMAAAGVASRRTCEEFIFGGKVTVNGEIALLPQTLVDENDLITFNGKPLSEEDQKLYFILNKPPGYQCTSKKTGKNTKIVIDLFTDEIKERLFTVGRLDQFTTGLLLVTNDGHFANKVIHPSSNVLKEYLVKTGVEVGPEHLMAISNGTLVEGVFVKPHKVAKVRRGTLKIVVAEGKKREVRMLLAAAGLKALELTRIRIGALQLGPLPLGSWRPLTEQEKLLVFQK